MDDIVSHPKFLEFIKIVLNCSDDKVEEIYYGVYGEGCYTQRCLREHLLRYLIQYYDMQNVTRGMKEKFFLLYNLLRGE